MFLTMYIIIMNFPCPQSLFFPNYPCVEPLPFTVGLAAAAPTAHLGVEQVPESAHGPSVQ